MEKIKAFLVNEESPSADNLKELINTSLLRVQDNLQTQQDHLTELSAKREERRLELSDFEKTLAAEEHALELKLNECTLASTYLKESESDKNALSTDVHKLESEKKVVKNTKPSKHDEETLERGRKKLNYYKQLSGIRWDYGSLETTVKGYATNGKDHVHAFDYPIKAKESIDKLEDRLWTDVARGTGRPVSRCLTNDID